MTTNPDLPVSPEQAKRIHEAVDKFLYDETPAVDFLIELGNALNVNWIDVLGGIDVPTTE